MANFLFRCILALIGVTMLPEVGYPANTEQLQVSGLRVEKIFQTPFGNAGNRVYFSGGKLSSCAINSLTYSKLHVGDTVVVRQYSDIKLLHSYYRW